MPDAEVRRFPVHNLFYTTERGGYNAQISAKDPERALNLLEFYILKEVDGSCVFPSMYLPRRYKDMLCRETGEYENAERVIFCSQFPSND
jgi:hypothetical protein